MTTAQALGSFAASLRWSDVPGEVRHRVRWIVADTIAAIIGGAAEPEMRSLTQARSGAGACTMLGTGARADAEAAALVNGTAGTFLEMDEGNRFARGHAGVHVVPAALAWCEAHEGDTASFLGAVLAGYEVCSRVAAFSQLRADIHPHGTWGTLGAAMAAGYAAREPAERLAELLGIASSLMTATSKRTMLEGGLVRNVYAGLANRNGLLALQLLQSGFSAERDGLRTLFGTVLSTSYDESGLLASLRGDSEGRAPWHVLQNYFKLHSCCRYNHGTLDALDALAARAALPLAQDVARVEVVSYDLAAELCDPAPRNTLAAKFSVPFAVATRLVTGSSGVSSFSWDAVRNPEVLALAARVTVREDPAYTRRLPQERPARVTLHLRTGDSVRAEVGTNRGDEAAPYTEAELTAKFVELTTRLCPRSQAQRLLAATLDLGEGTTMADWLALLRHAPAA